MQHVKKEEKNTIEMEERKGKKKKEEQNLEVYTRVVSTVKRNRQLDAKSRIAYRRHHDRKSDDFWQSRWK